MVTTVTIYRTYKQSGRMYFEMPKTWANSIYIHCSLASCHLKDSGQACLFRINKEVKSLTLHIFRIKKLPFFFLCVYWHTHFFLVGLWWLIGSVRMTVTMDTTMETWITYDNCRLACKWSISQNNVIVTKGEGETVGEWKGETQGRKRF